MALEAIQIHWISLRLRHALLQNQWQMQGMHPSPGSQTENVYIYISPQKVIKIHQMEHFHGRESGN